MTDLILPYLFGLIATGIVLFLSSFMFIRGRKEYSLYQYERSLLPDAVRLEQLQELKRNSEVEYDSLSSTLQDARLLVTQKEDAEKWLSENREDLMKFRAEREDQEVLRLKTQRLIENREQEEQKHQNLLAQTATQKAEIEYWKQHQERAKGEADIAADRLQKANDEFHRVQEQIQPLKTELAGIEKQIKAREDELTLMAKRFERQIKQMTDEVESNQQALKDSINNLKKVNISIEQANVQLSETLKKESELAAAVGALKQEKLALEELIKNLREDWNTVLRLAGQDEGADQRRTQELWNPYFEKKSTDFTQPQLTGEIDKLEATDRYLKSLKLYFPQRVLWAFHTSLKVNDISPLVVLAGISGTGKSVLPHRYAEAMGMHFLNVAVQPRWDSPQDMFGFFNYLENRFRATQLARALVQMDPFFEENDRGWNQPEDWHHSLSEQMLIVLLDEMNLARVEYYFSEFLSRLEIRREINSSDPDKRKEAEIGLEVGSGKTTSPVMQLFVQRNVLFVGTMNEDETTQALSDKVIDRANVLRFGRPGQVDLSEHEKPEINAQERISFELWQEWSRNEHSLSEDKRSEVNEYINRLDVAMNQVKRPFGFRTRKSILTYVANYPSNDADALEDALADQIEQKILPKFRGLDPRDHDVKLALAKVSSVLEDLGDGLLVEAINNTSRESHFVWMGVNRFDEDFRTPG